MQFLLDEVNVYAKKDSVFQQAEYAIIDFDILNNDILILERNNNKSSNYRLLLTNSCFDPVAIFDIPFFIKPISIFKDCLSHCHFITKDTAYQIVYTDSLLSINYPVEINYFHEIMDDCLFKIDSNMYFQRIFNNGYSCEFYSVNINSKQVEPFMTSTDTERL